MMVVINGQDGIYCGVLALKRDCKYGFRYGLFVVSGFLHLLSIPLTGHWPGEITVPRVYRLGSKTTITEPHI